MQEQSRRKIQRNLFLSELQSFRASELQSFKASELQSFRASELESFNSRRVPAPANVAVHENII